jgi:hypothetical protein
MARMSGWLRLSVTQFETEEDVITFLLVNMEGTASAWALPHLANMGTDKATIKSVNDFDKAFERAFFDPDEQRAAERKITSLTQTSTTAAYATEFRTLLMSLDWNDAALRAQFYKGLHWHVKQQLAQKEDQPQDLKALISAAIRIDNVRRELEISRPRVRTVPSLPPRPPQHALPTLAHPASTPTGLRPTLTMSLRQNDNADGMKSYASSVARLDIASQNVARGGRARRKGKKLPRLPRNSRKKSRV